MAVHALDHNIGREILTELASLPAPLPSFAIRRGDLEPTRSNAKEHHYWVEGTFAACLLAYLKNTRIGPHVTAAARYQQHPLGTADCHGGYHVDDWLRAAAHFVYFILRRERPTNFMGRMPRDQKVLPIRLFKTDDAVSTTQSPDVLAQAEAIDQSIASLQQATSQDLAPTRLDLATLMSKVETGAYMPGEILGNRLQTMLVARQLQGRYGLHGKGVMVRGKAFEIDNFPVRLSTIKKMVADLMGPKGRFRTPRLTQPVSNLQETLPGFFDASETQITEFMNQLENMSDEMLAIDDGIEKRGRD